MKSMEAAMIAAFRRARTGHVVAAALVAVLALSPAIASALPAVYQDAPSTANAPLVIAQGIAKLPRGDVLWTVRRIDVPGGDGIASDELPLGFVVADGGAIALQNEDDDVLALLDAGEAAFLPAGRGGAIVSQGADPAGAFEIALVSQRQAEAGEAAGNAAGAAFAAPDGAAFELELARGVLAPGNEAAIPAARSGAPVLFLLTDGAAQLASGDQVVDLAAGQFALLAGDVLVRGAGDVPASFVVAAIGAATGARADTAGTPEARAGRGDRQRTRVQDGGGGGGQQASAGGQRTPREGRGGRGGRGGQGGGQGQSGTGGAPGAGGGSVEQPQVPGGTPAAETPIPIPATPDAPATPDTTIPDDGTPAAEATLTPTPAGDVIEETLAGDEPSEEVEEFPTSTPESPPAEETAPAAEEPIAEEIAPPAEEPAAEAADPAADAPVEEAPVEEVPIEEAPAVVEEPVVVETPAA